MTVQAKSSLFSLSLTHTHTQTDETCPSQTVGMISMHTGNGIDSSSETIDALMGVSNIDHCMRLSPQDGNNSYTQTHMLLR